MMGPLNQVCGSFRNRVHARLDISSRDRRHNTGVYNPEIRGSIYKKLRIAPLCRGIMGHEQAG